MCLLVLSLHLPTSPSASLQCCDAARDTHQLPVPCCLDFPDTRIMSQIKLFLLFITQHQVFCYSKIKLTEADGCRKTSIAKSRFYIVPKKVKLSK
jgi:hypothetical protein